MTSGAVKHMLTTSFSVSWVRRCLPALCRSSVTGLSLLSLGIPLHFYHLTSFICGGQPPSPTAHTCTFCAPTSHIRPHAPLTEESLLFLILWVTSYFIHHVMTNVTLLLLGFYPCSLSFRCLVIWENVSMVQMALLPLNFEHFMWYFS